MAASAPLIAPDDVVHIAGHRGLAGSAIWRELEASGQPLIGRTSADLDLRNREAVFDFYRDSRPDAVVLAAARVGGILANSTQPADFLSDNIRIQVNVLDAALEFGVKRLLFLGSSCIYPRVTTQPIPESALLTGPLEPTNEAYAIAKIAGVLHVQALRRQHGRAFISAMPTNLYGPGDNFDLQTSHVLAAMIRRFHEAKQDSSPVVTLWGSGSPQREFLHVDDLARACIKLLGHYDDDQIINVGTGRDIAVRDLADLVAGIVGYEGDVTWDVSKPDGTPRKLLDVTRLNALGWQPEVALADGIRATYAWYQQSLVGSV